ncbi:MAG: hypothetical protein G01um101466_11 [Parcubacteria group bacterium Gr01-1014_66]|nr:MAG: hypothetical protein G01um101466_11 [Parcubacteria group bacterium Gr01-1014_66]
MKKDTNPQRSSRAFIAFLIVIFVAFLIAIVCVLLTNAETTRLILSF